MPICQYESFYFIRYIYIYIVCTVMWYTRTGRTLLSQCWTFMKSLYLPGFEFGFSGFSWWYSFQQNLFIFWMHLLPYGMGRDWFSFFIFSSFNYSGDTDAVIPVTSTRYSIDALKLQPISPWRPWYSDGQVGGWTQEYEGLNFVTVRGAGHEVPLHRPKEALALFNCFISGSSMPKLQQITDS